MPESLARASGFDFLSADEALALNQIRGHTYLSMFGVIEEFILPFVMDHARPHLDEDDWRTRALLQFAGEEAKHIHLFKRFRETFERDFGVDCAVIGPPAEIARAVLAHDPLGVALVILQAEWMTQKHYLESVKDDAALDSRFKSLLRHHWMEEAQHAKLDTLMVDALAENRTLQGREAGIEAYLSIARIIDAGLANQVDFDLAALEKKIGRTLAPADRATFKEVQLQANRWTYLGSGMTHPAFLESVSRVLPAASVQIEEMAPAFSVHAHLEA
jgi:hypothetical protein